MHARSMFRLAGKTTKINRVEKLLLEKHFKNLHVNDIVTEWLF